MTVLRDYQLRAIDGGKKALAEHRSVCLAGPTGCGKTSVGAALAWEVGQGQVLWLCNRRDLHRQTEQRVRACGTMDWAVRTVQGITDIRALADYKCIVIDECHHAPTISWQRVVNGLPNAKIIGLTASPERADGAPLSGMFESLVKIADYSELLEQEFLVPCRVFRPGRNIEQGLAQDPLTAYQRHSPGMTGFVFVVNIEQAKRAQASFEQAGIKTAIVEGRSKEKFRTQAVADLASGAIRLIINCATMTEGVDVPSAQVCILARRCGHSGIYIQTTGRVLRPFPGKQYGMLLDLVGASVRHGLPTQNREYSLTGTAIRQSEAIPVRQCYVCGAVMESWRKNCITCGADFVPGVFKPPKIINADLLEVYNGSETADAWKLRELTRLAATERFAVVAKKFAALFGRRPTPHEWAQLPVSSIHKEWTALARKSTIDKASVILKSYTGVYPPWSWRNEL